MKKLIPFILFSALCFSLLAPKALALSDEEILQRISALEGELTSLKGLLTKPVEEATSTEVQPVVNIVPECHQGINGSWNYCSLDCPCDNGQGDCDNHLECKSGYCAYDTGSQYGFTKTIDVCQPNPKAPAITPLPAVKTSSVEQANYLYIKGRVLDEEKKTPLLGVFVKGTSSNKNGIFEIKINQDINKETVKIQKEGYFETSFVFCKQCWGYQQAIVKPALFGEAADTVFPVLSEKIDLGDFALLKANNLKILSDRFVKVEVQVETKNSVFVSVFQDESFSQEKEIKDVLLVKRNYRVLLTDKQGNIYTSPLYLQEGELPAVLTFIENEFLWGVCGNKVCEKEDTICAADCENACLENKEQQCLFGCQDGACKKDILLSYPQTETALENSSLEIEWLQAGLDDKTLDLEVLAFDENGELVKGFQQMIATSVSANLGAYSWTLPNDLPKENQYKIAVYNKMCSESGELLVTCLKERYLSKSAGFLTLKEKEDDSFFQAQLANISQTATLILKKIQDLLK